jgi:hypothetical protein
MVGSGRSPTAKRSSPSSFNRSAIADFRAIKILLDTCGTSRARPTRHLPRLRLREADEKVIEQIKARFSIGKPEQ